MTRRMTKAVDYSVDCTIDVTEEVPHWAIYTPVLSAVYGSSFPADMVALLWEERQTYCPAAHPDPMLDDSREEWIV